MNVHNGQQTTIEDLAGMVRDGFAHVDKRLDGIDGGLDYMDARLGRIEADISEIRGEVVYRHEFKDALGRIKYVERKLGIESGA